MPLAALLSHSANLIQFYFAIFLCQQVCFILFRIGLDATDDFATDDFRSTCVTKYFICF